MTHEHLKAVRNVTERARRLVGREKGPRTPEHILNSHGIISITEWLKNTAQSADVPTARLALKTVEGDVYIDATFRDDADVFTLMRPSREPNPFYGRIAGTKNLRVLVLETSTPQGVTREAKIVQLPDSVIQSHDIPHPQPRLFRRKKHLTGIAELVDMLAKEKDPQKQQKITQKIRAIYNLDTLNENIPGYFSSGREVTFARQGLRHLYPGSKTIILEGKPTDAIQAYPLLGLNSPQQV